MANVSRINGFRPVRHLDGSPYNGQFTLFLMTSGDSVATFIGDAVAIGGSAGSAGQTFMGMDVEGMPTAVTQAASSAISTGANVLGVVKGFLPDPTDLSLKHRKASTNRIAMVITDNSVIYEIQEDTTLSLAAADVGLNVEYNTGAGSATTGNSGSYLISTGKATTSTLPLRLLGLAKRPDNAIMTASDPAKWEVIFNANGLSMGGAGVAGA